MNYRHIYHAGNFADVIKHLVMIQVIKRIMHKETPFFVLDTHAGIGLYDLFSQQAQKTKEADSGIFSLIKADIKNQDLIDYIELIRSFNEGDNIKIYPGSPSIVSKIIRKRDRLLACELHPKDYITLSNNMNIKDKVIKIQNLNGYDALKSKLPPGERRGLVLIDPPFEAKDEFATLTENIKEALKKWPMGTYVIWLPIKKSLPTEKFYEDIKEISAPKTLLIQCWVKDENEPDTLNGCAIIIINTPWKVDEAIKNMIPELEPHICPKNSKGIQMRWLVEPKC